MCIYVCVFVCVCIYMCVCVYVYIYIYIYICMCIYVCVYIYIYIYIYMYMLTLTYCYSGDINLDGLQEPIDWEQLFSLPKHYWLDDTRESRRFLEDQVGADTPKVLWELLAKQEKAFLSLPGRQISETD